MVPVVPPVDAGIFANRPIGRQGPPGGLPAPGPNYAERWSALAGESGAVGAPRISTKLDGVFLVNRGGGAAGAIQAAWLPATTRIVE